MRSLLLSLALPVVCLAQAPKPVLTFAKLHHDFGQVAADRKVAHRFKATNTGMAPLQIKQVVPSCGCTYTLVGQWYLKPGESTEIEATFNPAGMRGVVRKSMQIISDDPVNPTITLSFEAEVIQEIMPSTTALFFDEMLRNAPPRKANLRLESGNGQVVQVIDAKAPGAPYLSASFRTEGKDVLVEVSLDARKVPLTRSSGVDVLTIRTTSERMALIPINIQWALRPSILATPSRVAWVEASGKDLRTVVTLKHADGKAFRILSVKTTHPLLRAEGIGKTAGQQQEVAVVLGSQAKVGSYNERVILTLDDPDQPELEIRVSAILR